MRLITPQWLLTLFMIVFMITLSQQDVTLIPDAPATQQK